MEIEFYNNRAVGKNHSYWSRHLGKIVRDKHICPIQVKTWKDLTELDKQHMWDAVKKTSNQNSTNRVNGVMPHRTGSKPHRQLIYDMGGKDNNPPDIAKIFYETRHKNGKFVESKAQEKYDEIVKTIQSTASLSHIEVVEKCFGPQRHSHVFGFGGGMKRKHFNCSQATYIKDLEAKLHEKEEDNNNLKRRMDGIESRLAKIENENQPTSDEPAIDGEDDALMEVNRLP
ncbi:uncharacterized protein LOC121987317 [Zingiber officinale]|uniref:uncharacterized protein LOC121987317 n=1 Tax=Zingiber officinale TaxID=94328 RepID=UPI001C4CCF5C|nr:uncharacterized protein LOC121987317 [Zingiber officinale]